MVLVYYGSVMPYFIHSKMLANISLILNGLGNSSPCSLGELQTGLFYPLFLF
jgi:hypothetical protein